VHESGELIEWDVEGEPAGVDGEQLKRSVEKIAFGSLLIRHYPIAGLRHDAALVLGGLPLLAVALNSDIPELRLHAPCRSKIPRFLMAR
jgi:hypothetical protein